MKRSFLIITISFCMSSFMTCFGQDMQNTAKRLNTEIDNMLNDMPSISDDTLSYYENVVKLMKTAVLCDYFDSKADSKGKIKLHYRHDNSKRLSKFLSPLIDAGMYEYSRRKNDDAMEIFKLYLDCTDGPLFQKENQNVGLVAYYVSLLSFGKEDYDNAKRYADLALKDANFAHDAAEIKINCNSKQLVTKADSLKYVSELIDLYDKMPENMAYFKMLTDYFSVHGHEREVLQFAVSETEKHPENKLAWVLKGEAEQKNKHWDNAIESFKHALDIDSTYVLAVYNIGKCYFDDAKQLKDSLQGSKLRFKKTDDIKYRELLQSAKKWIVEASILDPKQDIVEWKQVLEYINKVIR
ncbi:MAG: hypothetical protein HEQ28_01815 [Prevotella sp.]